MRKLPVPCTNRFRVISQPISVEREAGEKEFEKSKQHYEVILSPSHTVKVNKIFNRIIWALHTEKAKMNSDSVSHLDGLNWEILVVNKCYIETYSHAGGKIVTTVASVQHHTDEELATILAHEVAHVVARHPAELKTN
ncbi:hypothetical protein P8452_40712 [Trifolium repens]|nr:hypothetical protein P8452_40712 [Trifolium repens]